MTALAPDRMGVAEVARWAEWLTSLVGEGEWKGRRADIEMFYQDILNHKRTSLYANPFVPDDMAAWHLYICETYVSDPARYPIAQGARNIPVVLALMREWDRLQEVDGVPGRLRHAFLHEPQQFDTTLFEMLVAAAYVRNGWKNVAFIPESPTEKRPDLQAVRRKSRLYIECKRKSRVSDYARDERSKWLRMFEPIGDLLVRYDRQWVIDVVFHVPLQPLPDDYLLERLGSKLRLIMPGTIIDDAEMTVQVRRVDLGPIRRELRDQGIRADGSRFPYLLFGHDEPWRGVTFITRQRNREDLPHVVDDVDWAAGGIWSCDAPATIQAKARSVKRDLVKAIRQLPDGEPGVVHWGIEIYDGEHVERTTYHRTIDTIANFGVGSKDLQWLYTHHFEFTVPVDGAWDVFETCHWAAKNATGNKFLLESPMLITVDS